MKLKPGTSANASRAMGEVWRGLEGFGGGCEGLELVLYQLTISTKRWYRLASSSGTAEPGLATVVVEAAALVRLSAGTSM